MNSFSKYICGVVLALLSVSAVAATGDSCVKPPKKVVPPPAKVVPPPKNYTVELWGDSIALSEAPHLAAHLPGSKVVNRAGHGNTIANYSGTLEGTQVLVIATGTNEPDVGIGADVFKQSLTDAVTAAQRQGTKVILVTPQRPRSDYPVDVTLTLQAVRDVAKTTGAVLVDRYAIVGKLSRDERLKTQVLPTARAADLVAREVAAKVKA